MEQTTISEKHKSFQHMHYQGDLSARLPHADGKPYHTFRTYTVLVDGEDLHFQDCVFENLAGPGKEVGQAIALYLDGDGITLENCRLIGHQDTLFLAPLPEKEREVDGFLGPKQFLPRTPHIYRFKNCLIEGGVDFIFGGGEAYFEDCEFRSVEPGYVFAPSTPQGQTEGFVARNCRFTAAEGVAEHSCYLGRPWRDYGKITLENCYIGAHIHPLGFDDWGRPESHDRVRFIEKGSYGPGANAGERASFVRVTE